MRDDIGAAAGKSGAEAGAGPELGRGGAKSFFGAAGRDAEEGLARPEPRWSRDGLCLLPAAAGGRDSGLSPEPIH